MTKKSYKRWSILFPEKIMAEIIKWFEHHRFTEYPASNLNSICALSIHTDNCVYGNFVSESMNGLETQINIDMGFRKLVTGVRQKFGEFQIMTTSVKGLLVICPKNISIFQLEKVLAIAHFCNIAYRSSSVHMRKMVLHPHGARLLELIAPINGLNFFHANNFLSNSGIILLIRDHSRLSEESYEGQENILHQRPSEMLKEMYGIISPTLPYNDKFTPGLERLCEEWLKKFII